MDNTVKIGLGMLAIALVFFAVNDYLWLLLEFLSSW